MANIKKKYSLSASGILAIDKNTKVVGIENTDTGEILYFDDLLEDFGDKLIKLSIAYDEDYE